jgi:hypothetical protein
VGRAAAHAGDPTLRSTPRVFGVILDHGSPDFSLDSSPLTTTLRECGAQTAYEFDYYANGADSTMQTALVTMRERGVTSIFCLCAGLSDVVYATAATNEAYYPEWLVSTYLGRESSSFELGIWPPNQRADAFGITVEPREVKWIDNPVQWALTEADPGGGWAANGQPPASQGGQTSFEHEESLVNEYRDWLMLASGIQMAGPILTPQRFQAGLQRAIFPNPDTSIVAGHVGFIAGSHSMTLDAAELWFSNTAENHNPSADTGTVCYVAGGARHNLGAWPRGGDPFFVSACDSGAYAGEP